LKNPEKKDDLTGEKRFDSSNEEKKKTTQNETE